MLAREGRCISRLSSLILGSLMNQNIMLSISKLLDFDRVKTTATIAIGSLIPMGMCMMWCYATLGGGLDGTSTTSAVLGLPP